jgi:hypothetical protein
VKRDHAGDYGIESNIEGQFLEIAVVKTAIKRYEVTHAQPQEETIGSPSKK